MEIFLLLQAAYVMQTLPDAALEQARGSSVDIALSFVLIVLTTAVLLAFAGHLFLYVRDVFWRARRLALQAAAKSANSSYPDEPPTPGSGDSARNSRANTTVELQETPRMSKPPVPSRNVSKDGRTPSSSTASRPPQPSVSMQHRDTRGESLPPPPPEDNE